MKKKTEYEWDLETYDPETDEVIDHDFEQSCKRLLKAWKLWGRPQNPAHAYRLCLVRTVWECDAHGEPAYALDREWAYVQYNQLPKKFDAHIKVPKRYAIEFESAFASEFCGTQHAWMTSGEQS